MSYQAKYGERPDAFLRAMQRYVTEYVNLHSPDVMGEVMTDDYAMRYGAEDIVGYAGEYRRRVDMAMTMFPNICLTVHEVAFNGERFAMHYTEHGRAEEGVGTPCAWAGVGLYTFNGDKLSANLTQQDLQGLYGQLGSGHGDPVQPPLTSPWDTPPEAPNPQAEQVVRRWLDSGAIATTSNVMVDDQHTGRAPAVIIDHERFTITDIFSAGDRVAFGGIHHGSLAGDFCADEGQRGQSVEIDVAGIVHVKNGSVSHGNVIRDRKTLWDKLNFGT